MQLFYLISSFILLDITYVNSDNNNLYNESKSHYEYLEVDKYANLNEIKKKYRILALKYHPDKVIQTKINYTEYEFEELKLLFLKIQEAYGILSDPELRIQYDLQQSDPEFYGDKYQMNNDINDFNKYNQLPFHFYSKYANHVRAHFYAEFNRPPVPELKGVVKVPIKYIFTGIYVYIYIYKCVYMNVYMNVYIIICFEIKYNTTIYTYIHTYIYIYIYRL